MKRKILLLIIIIYKKGQSNFFLLLNLRLYGCLNGVLFTIFLVFCIIAHLRACLSNPGYISITNFKIDFSDLHAFNDDNANEEEVFIW